jgi:tetratricopeptide (TPR) repeat protein
MADQDAVTAPGSPEDPEATRIAGSAQAAPWAPIRTPPPVPGAMAGEAQAGPLSVGQPFGPRYHIVKLLGLGGMGAVYQAWDAELGVVVALKVIRPEVAADPSAAAMLERRFKQELLLARQVTHKNVVRIHELGEMDGIKYITMPFIEGDDLATILKREQKLPIDGALKIARGVASGLEAAHAAGVVHRDLKPANLLVDIHGDVMIMDFGVARSTGGTNPGVDTPGASAAPLAAGGTMVGTVVGTVEYMAPEQARAQPVDQRADIYAFGLILYDMLLGRRRVTAAGPLAELTTRMESAPPEPRTIDPHIPEPLNRIVFRCIQPQAGDRFQTTTDLVSALNRLDDRGQLLPVVRRVTRRLTAGVLAVFLGLLGLTWWLARVPPADVARPPMTVLIADFENATGDPVFDGALEQALSVGVEGASFITSYPRSEAQRIARTLERRILNEESARLVAVRENIDVVLAGAIAADGNGYRLTLKAINPAPDAPADQPLAAAQEQARSKSEVLAAIGSIASDIRKELGDTEPVETMASDSVSAGSVDAVKAYSQAQELQVAGLKPEALGAYEKAVELDPKFGLAYSGAAITAFELGRDEDAKKYWQTALTLMDRMSERERLRVTGAYYLGLGRNFRSAIDTFQQLVDKYPGDRSGQGNLALAHFWSLDMRKALEVGGRLVELTPNDALNRSNYALYAMYAGDFVTAEKETLRVIEQQPSFSVAYLPVAIAALARSDLAAARAGYERMAKTPEPGPSMATLGLADIAMYEGNYAMAQSLLTPAIAADRASGNVAGLTAKSIALAETYEALGRPHEAVATARETLKIGSTRPTAFSAAMVLLRNGQAADARAVAQNLSQQPPQQLRAYGKVLEGRLAVIAKRPVDAIDAFLEAIKLADIWIARFELGVAYVETRHHPEALAELLRCHQRRGEATALFLDENPTFRYLAPLQYWLARAQQGLGMSQPAAMNFKTFLDLRGSLGASDALVADARKRISSLK